MAFPIESVPRCYNSVTVISISIGLFDIFIAAIGLCFSPYTHLSILSLAYIFAAYTAGNPGVFSVRLLAAQ